jgi:hypothetical protein
MEYFGQFDFREMDGNVICVLHSGVSEGGGRVIGEYVCDRPHVFAGSITIAVFFTLCCLNFQ